MQEEWGTGRSGTDWQIEKQDWTSCVSGLYNPQGLIHLPSVRWETHTDIKDKALRKCPELLYISLVSSFPKKKCLIAALAQSPDTYQLVSTTHPVHNYVACLMVLCTPYSLNYTSRTVNSSLYERRPRKPPLVWQVNFPPPSFLCSNRWNRWAFHQPDTTR